MDFWDVHGLFFIIFMMFFPRLTMLFSGVCGAWSGLLFWIGWVLAPRLTVACLATTVYWDTNPIICVFAWLWCLGGEYSEKQGAVKVNTRNAL